MTEAEAASPAIVLKITKKIKIASTFLPPTQETNSRRLGRRVRATGESMHPGLRCLALDLLLTLLQQHL
jgi:hypothetical protein